MKEIDSKVSSLSANWLNNPEDEDYMTNQIKIEEDYSEMHLVKMNCELDSLLQELNEIIQ